MSTDDIIDGILNREGGFVNDPNDSAGATKYGVTIGTLSSWLKRRATIADVKNLTADQARQILHQEFITGPGFDKIDDPILQEQVVDASVNFNPQIAQELLQKVVGVKVDYSIGKGTIAALDAMNPAAFMFDFTADKFELYAQSKAHFANGLLNRCAAMLDNYADEKVASGESESSTDVLFARQLAAELHKYGQDPTAKANFRKWFRQCAKECRDFAAKLSKAAKPVAKPPPKKRALPPTPSLPTPVSSPSDDPLVRLRPWNRVKAWKGTCFYTAKFDEPGNQADTYTAHWVAAIVYEMEFARVAPFSWNGSITMIIQTYRLSETPTAEFVSVDGGSVCDWTVVSPTNEASLTFTPDDGGWTIAGDGFDCNMHTVFLPSSTHKGWQEDEDDLVSILPAIDDLMPAEPTPDLSIHLDVDIEPNASNDAVAVVGSAGHVVFDLVPVEIADEDEIDDSASAMRSQSIRARRPRSGAKDKRNNVRRRTFDRRTADRPIDDEQVAPVVDAVYLLDPPDTIHLTPLCPAVDVAATELEEIGVPITDDLEGLSRHFGAPVCRTCLRMIVADMPAVSSFQTNQGMLEICGDRLRLTVPAGLFATEKFKEIPYFRIDMSRASTFGASLLISYSQPIPDHRSFQSKLKLKLSSKQERDCCLDAIDKAVRKRLRL